MAAWSVCWKAPRPMPSAGTRVVTTTTGAPSESASSRPVRALAKLGPELTARTAGRPETAAWPIAAQAPARWSRTPTTRSPGTVLAASIRPGSSDGRPTTRSHPASARVPATTSQGWFSVVTLTGRLLSGSVERGRTYGGARTGRVRGHGRGAVAATDERGGRRTRRPEARAVRARCGCGSGGRSRVRRRAHPPRRTAAGGGRSRCRGGGRSRPGGRSRRRVGCRPRRRR